MNRRTAVERVVDMHLVQCNEKASRDPSFVATLPFDPNDVQRRITDRVLDRTRRRWTWFSTARERNPSLGTLSHLPAEIRQHIWQSVLQCRRTLSADGLWEYEGDLGSIFRPSSYYFGFGRRPFVGSHVENLRLVSAAVQEEYDAIFFQQSFRFNNPANLTKFFDHLAESQRARVVSVEMGLCLLYSIESWTEPILRLPPELRQMHFRIYPTMPERFQLNIGRQSAEPLRKLVQSVIQRFPNTKIRNSSTNEEPLSAQDQGILDYAFGITDRNDDGRETLLDLRHRDAFVNGVWGVVG